MRLTRFFKRHTVMSDAMAQRLVNSPVLMVKMINLLIIVSDLHIVNECQVENYEDIHWKSCSRSLQQENEHASNNKVSRCTESINGF